MSEGAELIFAGQRVQHSFFVHHLISQVLLKHGKEIRSIVELGTGLGGLTAYLGLWGLRLDVPVHTFDINAYALESGTGPLFKRLGVSYSQVDIFADSGAAQVRRAIGTAPAYLICDNGNKPREFQTFVPGLSSGSIVSTHDWGAEIHGADVEQTVAANDLRPYRPELWSTSGAMFATWLKG
jgi:hypothetical protein